MNFFIGIDPGQSGGIGILYPSGAVVQTFKFKDQTDSDISDMFEFIANLESPVFAMFEKVHSMPKQGVSSSFTFGDSFGFLRGMLVAHKIPWDYVQPRAWQKALGCLTKGDKNITKSKAQRQWPDQKITHAIADALLIAEYCRIIKT
jgi:hypothetical protein